jgi:chromate reductase
MASATAAQIPVCPPFADGRRLRVVALNGSLRRRSHNRRLLHAARRLVPVDCEFEIWSKLAELPPYNEDVDGHEPPRPVRLLRAELARADAVLIATPEYNASIPGALKNAIDWASRPYPNSALTKKPAAVVGASTGLFGAVWAQAELRKVLRTVGANVVERELAVASADDAFREDGSLRDERLAAALAEIVGELLGGVPCRARLASNDKGTNHG